MSGKKFINMLAFIGLVFIAAALILARILGWVGVSASIVGAMTAIGQWLAYLVTIIYSFFYIRSKRNILWWVIYIVAVVVVVLLILL